MWMIILSFHVLDAGSVDSIAAIDLGLSYDVSFDEYIRYLIGCCVDVGKLGIEVPANFGNLISVRDLNLCSLALNSMMLRNNIFFWDDSHINDASINCVYMAGISEHAKLLLTATFIWIKVVFDGLVFGKEDNV